MSLLPFGEEDAAAAQDLRGLGGAELKRQIEIPSRFSSPIRYSPGAAIKE